MVAMWWSKASLFPLVVPLCGLGLVSACGDSEGGRQTSDTGILSLGGTQGDGDESGSAGDGDGDGDGAGDGQGDGDGDGDDEIKFDLAALPDGTGGDMREDECQKVDLLFVIDNSGSMEDEQASLVASFGGFVAGIQATLDSAESYHIGVVTTDKYSSNAAGCTGLGALVTSTGGTASSASNCAPFSSGKRYLDDTEPDLTSKFACVAQVGIAGSGDEIQAEAGYKAVSPALNGPGACNDGFIREDALLVVVLITDEDDEEDCFLFSCSGGSSGGPADWFQTFTQYKGGIEENIVVLSLVGGAGNSCGADNCSRLINMTNMFTNGTIGDICAPSYAQFFNDAIGVIDNACSNFTPPG